MSQLIFVCLRGSTR